MFRFPLLVVLFASAASAGSVPSWIDGNVSTPGYVGWLRLSLVGGSYESVLAGTSYTVAIAEDGGVTVNGSSAGDWSSSIEGHGIASGSFSFVPTRIASVGSDLWPTADWFVGGIFFGVIWYFFCVTFAFLIRVVRAGTAGYSWIPPT